MNAAGEDMGTKNCIHAIHGVKNWSDQTGTNGWYTATTTDTIGDLVYVSGTVNRILCDRPSNNAPLIADKGIILNPDSHLIIWAQEEGTGQLRVYGQENYAGISVPETASLTINGGNISAGGGKGAPGLGSCGSKSGVITINGGKVDATGRDSDDGQFHAPGIGASDTPRL